MLLVDDDDAFRTATRKGLERSGFVVFDLPTGVGIESEVDRQAVDVVVTDLLMPEREGCESIMALRAARPDLPIVVVTGSGYGKTAVTMGASCCLNKPVSLDSLRQTIRNQAAREDG